MRGRLSAMSVGALGALAAAVGFVVLLPLRYDGSGDGQPAARQTAATQPGERPNILVYMIDTTRADELGCYGGSVTKTPNFDEFASQATVFVNPSSTSTATRPSVATLFTGVQAAVHGAENLGSRLPDDTKALPRLAELVRAQGYATIGVVANPNVSKLFGFNVGFDEYHELYDVPPNQSMARAEDLTADARIVVDKIEEVLAARPKDKPFYMYVLSIDPHEPYTPPPPYETMYDPSVSGARDGSPAVVAGFEQLPADRRPEAVRRMLALYRGEISYADHHFGRLISWLREVGLLDKTVVVVTADHGEEFMEHGTRGHGRSVYEELTHIPMLVRHPGLFKAGARVPEYVDMLDLSATIASLSGAARPAFWLGRDLHRPLTPRPIFVSQRTKKRSLWVVKFDGHKLIYDEIGGKSEYYYLPDDPREQSPLEGERRARLDKTLAGKLKEFQKVSAAVRSRIAKGAGDIEEDKLPDDIVRSLKALGYIGD